MNDVKEAREKRPVNLDISTIRLPLTAYASILHRVSGVLIFFGIAVLLWVFDMSLSSEEGFDSLREVSQSVTFKWLLWGGLSALAYHVVAGVRHLLMDLGLGESLEGGRLGAGIVLVVSGVLIVVLGVWIW